MISLGLSLGLGLGLVLQKSNNETFSSVTFEIVSFKKVSFAFDCPWVQYAKKPLDEIYFLPKNKFQNYPLVIRHFIGSIINSPVA